MGGAGDPLLPTPQLRFTATPVLLSKGARSFAAHHAGAGKTPPSRSAARPAAAAPAPARSHARSHAPCRPPEAAHSDARGERAGIGGCAEAPPRRQSGPAPGRMLRCGARRPPQATRARIPQKFGSGSVGSEMQPKPRSPPKPRADKHAQARTQTSPRPAHAAAGSRRQGRKEPGARRGRRLRRAAPGAAAHPHRSQGRRKRPASPARSNGATAGLGPQPRRPGRGGSGRRTQLVGGGAGRAGSWGGTGATGLEGRAPAALSGPAARSRPSAAAAPGRSGAPRPRLPSPVLLGTSWRGGSAPAIAEIAMGWAWGRCLWLNRADARKLQQVAPWRNG